MKNKDLIQLSQTLNQVSHIKGKEFAYSVFKNKALIETELKIFEQLRKDPHPDYANYENERAIICINYSRKNEMGSPIIENQQYVIEDWENFNMDMAELQEVKYKEVIDKMKMDQLDMESFMESESNIELRKVSFKDLPDDIDADLLDRLKFMIEY